MVLMVVPLHNNFSGSFSSFVWHKQYSYGSPETADSNHLAAHPTNAELASSSTVLLHIKVQKGALKFLSLHTLICLMFTEHLNTSKQFYSMQVMQSHLLTHCAFCNILKEREDSGLCQKGDEGTWVAQL